MNKVTVWITRDAANYIHSIYFCCYHSSFDKSQVIWGMFHVGRQAIESHHSNHLHGSCPSKLIFKLFIVSPARIRPKALQFLTSLVPFVSF